MCKFSSKSGGVPFQPLGDLTWNGLILLTIYDLAIGFSDEFTIVNNTDSGRIQTIVYKTVVLCLKYCV